MDNTSDDGTWCKPWHYWLIPRTLRRMKQWWRGSPQRVYLRFAWFALTFKGKNKVPLQSRIRLALLGVGRAIGVIR